MATWKENTDALTSHTRAAYAAVAAKGGSVPARQNTAGLAEAIGTLPSGILPVNAADTDGTYLPRYFMSAANNKDAGIYDEAAFWNATAKVSYTPTSYWTLDPGESLSVSIPKTSTGGVLYDSDIIDLDTGRVCRTGDSIVQHKTACAGVDAAGVSVGDAPVTLTFENNAGAIVIRATFPNGFRLRPYVTVALLWIPLHVIIPYVGNTTAISFTASAQLTKKLTAFPMAERVPIFTPIMTGNTPSAATLYAGIPSRNSGAFLPTASMACGFTNMPAVSSVTSTQFTLSWGVTLRHNVTFGSHQSSETNTTRIALVGG